MSEFKYVSRKEKKAMTMEQLAQYHCERRKYEYKNNIPVKGILWRKFAHPLVVGALKLDRILSHQKTTKMNSEKRPTIYVCTHIGGSDVERIIEALNRSGFLFFGDPGPMYKDPATHALAFLKGTVELETKDKEDRHISFDRALEVLTHGGDLMIFPEGAWNPFENLPVMKTYEGAARLGIASRANILPLAIEQYGDEFIFNKGEIIRAYDDMDVKMLNRLIRDTLATLKYEIWQTQPKLHLPLMNNAMTWEGVSVSKKVSLQREYDEIFRQSIIDRRSEYGSLDDVYSTMFIDPNETTADNLIATVQDRLTLLRELKYELQRVDELLVEASGKIENLSAFLFARESFDYFASKVQKIFDTIGDKLTKIEAIIAILKDERDKDLKEDELDPLFYSQLCELSKRRNSLLAQIDDFGEIKEKRLALK